MEKINKGTYLKIPTFDELKYTKALYECEKTMSFNQKWGGIVPFPEDKWQDFFEMYIGDKKKHIYFHIYNLDHVVVGEVSGRIDQDPETLILNIKVKYEYRGNNHAKEALELFLDYVFNYLPVQRVIDDVASDNIHAINFLEKFGFSVINHTSEIVLLELHKKDYF